MWMLTVRFQISNRTPRLPGVHSCGLTCGGAADRQTVETIGRLGGGGFSEIAPPQYICNFTRAPSIEVGYGTAFPILLAKED